MTTREPATAPPPIFEPVGAPVLRAPALPIESYLELSARGVDGFLAAISPEVREQVRCALAAASFSVLDAVDRPPASRAKAAIRARSLLRYLVRMAYRATPYGLFAGVAIARWSRQTRLALDRPDPIHVRPDMGWLLRFVAEAEADEGLRRQLRLSANPLTRMRAGRLLLGEPEAGSGAAAVSIRATGAARRALEAARRPVPYTALRERLLEATPGATPARVEGLLAELCARSFLQTELLPPLTADSPARVVASRLGRLAGGAPRAAALEAVLTRAGTCAAAPSPDAFRALAAAGTTAVPGAHPEPTFQVDMGWRLREGAVAEAVGVEAAAAAEALLRLGQWTDGPPGVAELRELFLTRFGPHRDVPLREVVEAEVGRAAPASEPAGTAAADQRRLDLAAEALYERRREVVLSDPQIRSLSRWDADPAAAPASLELLVLVLGRSAADVEAGDFRLLVAPNVGAGAMGQHLARFAPLLGEPVRSQLAEQAAREEALEPEALFAELVYRPRSGRSANVALRPAVRRREICVGSTSGLDDGSLLYPDDLLVGIRAGRLALLDRQSGRIVRVSCTTMLNHAHEAALVRLLAEIGQDGVPQLVGFDWGPASQLPFLPRVVHRRTVLAPAQWRLTDAGDTADPRAFAERLARWRARWEVPRHVCAGEMDNRLLLDLDAPAQADELRNELSRSGEGEVVVEEALPSPEDVWLPGPGGRYVCELVVPLGRRPVPDDASGDDAEEDGGELHAAGGDAARFPTEPPLAARLRPPGTDWLYLKLFVPRWAEVDFLLDRVAPFVESAVARDLAGAWWFVRYEAPEPHLRLRFRGPADRLRDRLLPEVCRWAAPLVETGACDRYEIDTYEREIERYGGLEGVEAAEQLFAADSAAVLGLLSLLRSGRIGLDPIALGMLSIDDMLGGLGLLPDRRLVVYEEADEAPDASSEVYRSRKDELRALLADPVVLRRLGGGLAGAVLDARRRRLALVAWKIADARGRGALTSHPDALYGSFVHMHCNRLFGLDWSAEELAVGLLRRVRDSYRHATADVHDLDDERL